MSAVIMSQYNPTYWLSGFVKVIIATISLITAVKLVYLVPQALAFSSPTQLEQAN
ncbi:hypothetical protein [Nostoc sp. 'Lobaria pulmonaria (5183) cyanobiont']|uniref:hypothetical protein n=1 Tax=Nostoc sp. 'Lobaria pulmonaria (5183) cyanobiont' TaxID=1618022 RepID=UPI001F279E1D|nr:hypothetical protein [Nostoc sp. 'Lobaria pulmonaria (5183) cyanobiont']